MIGIKMVSVALVCAATSFASAIEAGAQQRPSTAAPGPARPQSAEPARQPSSEPARPAPSTEPEATTATFSDWTLRCQRFISAATPMRVCEVSHSVPGQTAQTTVLQLAFAKLTPSDPLKLTMVAPVNVSFPSRPVIKIGDRDAQPVELEWRRCVPGGCIAELDVRDELLARWRAETGAGAVTLKDAAGRDAVLPISFRGLAQALDALTRS